MSFTLVVLISMVTQASADLSVPPEDATITAFYDAFTKKDVEAAVGLFAEGGIYVHTDQPTKKTKDGLRALFRDLFTSYQGPVSASVVDIQDARPFAKAVIVTRTGLSEAMKDSFFLVDGKIKQLMTTRAHSNDPAPKTVKPTVLDGTQSKDPVQEKAAVERAVDVYFTGFVGLNPEGMQSAFWEDPIYMFDFNTARQVPFGCSVSQDCGSAPYFTSRDELLPAFQGFSKGYINLKHQFEVVQVYGDLALATTVSFGCEGDFVTPQGSAPMPNREIFVLVKKNGKWKIKSYMFTYDPASPIKPPVSVCPPKASLSADLLAPAVDAGVAAFYDALSAKDVDAAVGVFADDGVYDHTGHKTARGKVGLRVLFQGLFKHYEGPVNASAVDVQVAGRHATSVIASRTGFRDSFFFADGKIKQLMTTRAHSNDPAPKTVKPTVLDGTQSKDPVQEKAAVERAVDVYFTGFVGVSPAGMQSAFWEDPIYMFDFNTARQVPFGCSVSQDCGSAPYFTSRDELLPAFQGFSKGYINLKHQFEVVQVYGDLALATTVSFGCEGDFVTPQGSAPMPNREIFVLVKKNGEWKIKSYMFTYDPASPIKPPVSVCPPPPSKCYINECGCPGSFKQAWCDATHHRIASSWCEKTSDNCEGACNGQWCGSVPPPPPPGKCYISECGCPDSFKKTWCSSTQHRMQGWCEETQDRCEKNCNGKWCQAPTKMTEAGKQRRLGRANDPVLV